MSTVTDITADDKLHYQKLKMYISGYVLSIVFTLAAYFIVSSNKVGNYWFVIVSISILAGLQFIVQLYFFLHLKFEREQKWKISVLAFMILVVAILVIGSVWIMNNLNVRMTPSQINNYMNNQDNL
jgi:cytochrome o ubiquinol oxidase operon protein cyoD